MPRPGSLHSYRPTRHDLPAWSHFVTFQKVLLQSSLSSFSISPITATRRSLGAGFALGPTDLLHMAAYASWGHISSLSTDSLA